MAMNAPRAGPWRRMALKAYSEQEGTNRQQGPSSGEIPT